MKALGINRISIGVQSFLDNELVTAERIHTAKETVKVNSELSESRIQQY